MFQNHDLTSSLFIPTFFKINMTDVAHLSVLFVFSSCVDLVLSVIWLMSANGKEKEEVGSNCNVTTLFTDSDKQRETMNQHRLSHASKRILHWMMMRTIPDKQYRSANSKSSSTG